MAFNLPKPQFQGVPGGPEGLAYSVGWLRSRSEMQDDMKRKLLMNRIGRLGADPRLQEFAGMKRSLPQAGTQQPRPGGPPMVGGGGMAGFDTQFGQASSEPEYSMTGEWIGKGPNPNPWDDPDPEGKKADMARATHKAAMEMSPYLKGSSDPYVQWQFQVNHQRIMNPGLSWEQAAQIVGPAPTAGPRPTTEQQVLADQILKKKEAKTVDTAEASNIAKMQSELNKLVVARSKVKPGSDPEGYAELDSAIQSLKANIAAAQAKAGVKPPAPAEDKGGAPEAQAAPTSEETAPIEFPGVTPVGTGGGRPVPPVTPIGVSSPYLKDDAAIRAYNTFMNYAGTRAGLTPVPIKTGFDTAAAGETARAFSDTGAAAPMTAPVGVRSGVVQARAPGDLTPGQDVLARMKAETETGKQPEKVIADVKRAPMEVVAGSGQSAKPQDENAEVKRQNDAARKKKGGESQAPTGRQTGQTRK